MTTSYLDVDTFPHHDSSIQTYVYKRAEALLVYRLGKAHSVDPKLLDELAQLFSKNKFTMAPVNYYSFADAGYIQKSGRVYITRAVEHVCVDIIVAILCKEFPLLKIHRVELPYLHEYLIYIDTHLIADVKAFMDLVKYYKHHEVYNTLLKGSNITHSEWQSMLRFEGINTSTNRSSNVLFRVGKLNYSVVYPFESFYHSVSDGDEEESEDPTEYNRSEETGSPSDRALGTLKDIGILKTVFGILNVEEVVSPHSLTHALNVKDYVLHSLYTKVSTVMTTLNLVRRYLSFIERYSCSAVGSHISQEYLQEVLYHIHASRKKYLTEVSSAMEEFTSTNYYKGVQFK